MSETTQKKFELTPAFAIVIAGVIIAGAIVYTNARASGPGNQNAQLPAPAAVNVPAPSAEDHIVGSPNAPIVLIEYSDFQCPYCTMVHPTLKRLVSESNGEVAWVMRHLPLSSIHPEALPAANAAECIAEQLGNTGWWKFADTVFANQKSLSGTYYEQVAKDLGADVAAYKACVASGKFSKKIADQEAEAFAAGGQGTPFTIVSGNGVQVPLSGALPYEQFEAVIKAIKNRQQ